MASVAGDDVELVGDDCDDEEVCSGSGADDKLGERCLLPLMNFFRACSSWAEVHSFPSSLISSLSCLGIFITA